jgi:very-short-patch-repair endonuclease
MTADSDRVVIVRIGKHVPTKEQKYHSAAEWKVARKMYDIAYETQSTISWSARLDITTKKNIEEALKMAIPWHQIDFVVVHDEIWNAIEIDGREFHGIVQDAAKDLDLLSSGWNVIRIQAKYAINEKYDTMALVKEFVLKNKQGKFLGIPENVEVFDNIQEDIETRAALKFLVEGPKSVMILEEMF